MSFRYFTIRCDTPAMAKAMKIALSEMLADLDDKYLDKYTFSEKTVKKPAKKKKAEAVAVAETPKKPTKTTRREKKKAALLTPGE